MEVVEYIDLGHMVDTISYWTIDKSFRKKIAYTIGEFINDKICNLTIIGNNIDVWEKLVDLLSGKFIEKLKNTIDIDQDLTDFSEKFANLLFSNGRIRKKLYVLAKIPVNKQLRRVLFKFLIQHQELLPNSRNDESELLVQVIAELWDSDKNWIINNQSQRRGLIALLGQLQEIDAVGARRLSDEIADFLIHHPN
ncbi:hypothetical protein A0J48_025840 [Sphaerospermopsis aphanizomenoides BCCUSP55]|nr:hypothetical protein [Sphaerospermopsis aphanizomenoides BCCUSP55]